MDICVVGAGMQGSVVAQDLVKSGHAVTVFDNNINILRQLKKTAKITAREINVTNKIKFIRTIKGFDLMVGALPSAMGYYTMDCAIRAGTDLVDLSYSPEDPFLLHEKAVNEGIKIVPDAGFAPGLSNVLIGETYQEFKGIDSMKIMVGGIPQHPEPPFNYHMTWSLADVIEEYTRPAKILKDNEAITVPALSGIEKLALPKIGELECFYTDGLRTLLKTMKHVKTMEEKTIRYPGHARLFKTLIDCGLFKDQSVRYRKRLVRLRDVNIQYLRNVLRTGDPEDMSIMLIQIVKGRKKRNYTCIDYYDKKKEITSMARMTAYTGSVIAQCIKKYEHCGIVPPEYLGMDKKLCHFIKSELKKRSIVIKKT
jgi:lysine 6-dehydrogenase